MFYFRKEPSPAGCGGTHAAEPFKKGPSALLLLKIWLFGSTYRGYCQNLQWGEVNWICGAALYQSISV